MKHTGNHFTNRANEFRVILERSLQTQNVVGKEARAAVYRKARATLTEHFAQTTESGGGDGLAFQQSALESAIQAIEKGFAQATPTQPVPPAPSRTGAGPAQNLRQSVRRPVIPAAPPPPPPVERSAAEQGARSIEVQRPSEPRTSDARSSGNDGLFDTEGHEARDRPELTTGTIDVDAVSADGQDTARVRNWLHANRFKAPLILISFTVCLAYLVFRPDIGQWVWPEGAAPSLETVAPPAAPEPASAPDDIQRVMESATPLLRPGSPAQGSVVAGRMETGIAGDPTATRISFDDLVVDIEWRADQATDSNIVHIINLVFARSAERVFAAGMIDVWSSQRGRFRTLKGTPVRLGLSRIVYGVSERLDDVTISHPELGAAVIARISIRFESGESVELIFPLKTPATAN
jgi:hypothetical protein